MKQPKTIERELKSLIFHQTAGFAWRPGFKKWRETRVKQEKHQNYRFGIMNKWCPNFKEKKILDLGCGMGGLLTKLSLEKARQITGLDFNFDYCRISLLRGKKYHKQLNILNGFGESLPFKDASFDLIICFEVLEHSQNYQTILKEIKRALKPQGAALITIPNRLGFFDPHYHLPLINWLPRQVAEVILKIFGREAKGMDDKQRLREMHYVYYDEFRALLKKLGFIYRDIQQEELTDPQQIRTPIIRSLVALAKSWHQDKRLYHLLAIFYLDTFQFLLMKRRR